MTQPKSSTSYPLEFFDFFDAASEREVALELDSRKAAQALRAKLYAFRSALRKEDHPARRAADNVEIVLRDSTLLGRPAGTQFKSVFAKAGITSADLPRDEPEPKKPPPSSEEKNETDDTLSKFYPPK